MVDNTWTVVQFLDDTTVEAVPSSWIQGNNCHWPSFAPEKLINAIKKSEPLNTCWPSHQIKIFRNATFDDYWIARNKAKIAENTSELETESDTGNNKKRKVIQKILSSSDEESIEESILPSPPKIKRPSKRNYGQENKNNGLEIMVQKSTNEVDSSSSDPLCQKNLNNLSSITSINDESIIRESTDQTTQCKCRFEIGETVKPLLQQGHILRGMMLEILGEVKQLRQELVARTQTTSKSFFRSVSSVVCPISCDEDMVLFEEYLQDSTDFNNAVGLDLDCYIIKVKN
uniref:Uncharacterized protein LOC114343840 n=1 Tax=Diabrotica virgifera virgifera TaxID=50390 RepID=A0A6P7GYH2_DIAVI